MASTYLSKTFGTATNRKKWTYSAWVKKSRPQASIDEQIFGSYADATTSYYSRIADNGSSKFEFTEYNGSGYSINLRPANIQRDPNGWYHIVIGYDSTQATASNRVKFYINGEQVTTWTQESYPSLNYESGINKNQLHTIGKETSNSSYYYDGSMSHIHFIDGTQYAASDFGETDSTTGIWKPKTAPSVTYGTNGFFLKFENSASMGTDSAGSNNWTVNGTMTQLIDTPSNIFSTMNPLQYSPSTAFSNGNLTVQQIAGVDAHRRFLSTLGVSQGKYYWENKVGANSNGFNSGITNGIQGNYDSYVGSQSNDVGYNNNGEVYHLGSTTTGLPTLTTGDIVGFALDLDNSYIYFAKNGTWINSGDPTSGATGTGGFGITSNMLYHPATSLYTNTQIADINFGNGYFGTTAVSSAQNPDDGIGIFEYDVPAGYRALCTKSINAQEYS